MDAPKERMKADKEHRVPLSQQAISLLKSIQAYTQPQDFIFPALNSYQFYRHLKVR